MAKPVAPRRESTLLSKTNLRRRLLEQTGATRISPEAVSELDEAIQELVTDLIVSIGKSWQAQAASRQLQGTGEPAPELRTRHVLQGLNKKPKPEEDDDGPEAQ